MEEKDKTMGLVRVEVHKTKNGLEMQTNIKGPNFLCIVAVAKAVKRLAELQNIPVKASVFGLLGVIDLLDRTDGVAIDAGAIQKARERHEE